MKHFQSPLTLFVYKFKKRHDSFQNNIQIEAIKASQASLFLALPGIFSTRRNIPRARFKNSLVYGFSRLVKDLSLVYDFYFPSVYFPEFPTFYFSVFDFVFEY